MPTLRDIEAELACALGQLDEDVHKARDAVRRALGMLDELLAGPWTVQDILDREG
jgi:hypothetical protein